MDRKFITGRITTPGGDVPVVSTTLTARDYAGTLMVRCNIRRNNYRVQPGLYAVGDPGPGSDVFVSANYKLSFDTLRKNLGGINAWILVLDTKGINVWCAAGKGTFGTAELVNRVALTSLPSVIRHRRIIVPQLGAVGVAAHLVKEQTGFTVLFGPVRAGDIKEYLAAEHKLTKEMRRVSFTLTDRMKLIPVDLFFWKMYIAAFVFIFIISGLSSDGISFSRALHGSLPVIRNIMAGYGAGIIVTPLLLPYIPFRSFANKGLASGIAASLIMFAFDLLGESRLEVVSWFLLIPAISSFMAMNFTGSSTFTSYSGVKKEMKTAVPVQIVLSAGGTILAVIQKLV